ncbi:hypothetical protein GGX14DRAFT_586343 [Mycena pura]|uniref:Uncharacterized protein n=1 Tax=Mycena pura TaxID=153505 RepID=A0AAD6YJV4_9AGAR|nr:hypothetical protein GGX14DRAFT_586343 [Mycena pura]
MAPSFGDRCFAKLALRAELEASCCRCSVPEPRAEYEEPLADWLKIRASESVAASPGFPVATWSQCSSVPRSDVGPRVSQLRGHSRHQPTPRARTRMSGCETPLQPNRTLFEHKCHSEDLLKMEVDKDEIALAGMGPPRLKGRKRGPKPRSVENHPGGWRAHAQCQCGPSWRLRKRKCFWDLEAKGPVCKPLSRPEGITCLILNVPTAAPKADIINANEVTVGPTALQESLESDDPALRSFPSRLFNTETAVTLRLKVQSSSKAWEPSDGAGRDEKGVGNVKFGFRTQKNHF